MSVPSVVYVRGSEVGELEEREGLGVERRRMAWVRAGWKGPP